MSDPMYNAVPPGGYTDGCDVDETEYRSVADIILDEAIEEAAIRRQKGKKHEVKR